MKKQILMIHQKKSIVHKMDLLFLEVDISSVGCIFSEIIRSQMIFPGTDHRFLKIDPNIPSTHLIDYFLINYIHLILKKVSLVFSIFPFFHFRINLSSHESFRFRHCRSESSLYTMKQTLISVHYCP